MTFKEVNDRTELTEKVADACEVLIEVIGNYDLETLAVIDMKKKAMAEYDRKEIDAIRNFLYWAKASDYIEKRTRKISKKY